MDSTALYKIFTFWFIFYITPGPVWVAVMETTRQRTFMESGQFFLKVFLPVNSSIQFPQAVICVVFIEWVSQIFAQTGLIFYVLGATYIGYLGFKTLKSKQANSTLDLSFANLVMVMLLSPKIWLLFPSGAVIAKQLSENLWLNAVSFGLIMLLVSNILFFFYVSVGKLGSKVLKENFAYLSFALLMLFALFLFKEAFSQL